MQFFSDDVRRPLAITHLARLRFFVRFAGRDHVTFFLFWVDISKFNSFVRGARDWQNFVRPGFRIIHDVDVCRHPPVLRFMRRHLMIEPLLKRLDLCLEFVFLQPLRQRLEKRIYRVIIPEVVEVFAVDSAAARRLIT